MLYSSNRANKEILKPGKNPIDNMYMKEVEEKQTDLCIFSIIGNIHIQRNKL